MSFTPTSHHNILDEAVHETFGMPLTDLFSPFDFTSVCPPPTNDFLSLLTVAEHLPLQNIQTEIIDNRFCFAQYLTFRVVMMRSNGYINGTTLVKTFGDGKKQYRFWLQNASTKSLVKSFVESTNISQWFVKVSGGGSADLQTRGCYIHPLLISSLMSWLSPSHALLVNNMVNTIVSHYHAEQNHIVNSFNRPNVWNSICHCEPVVQPIVKPQQQCSIEIYHKHNDDRDYPYFYSAFNEGVVVVAPTTKKSRSSRESIRKLSVNRYPKSELVHTIANTYEIDFRKFLKMRKINFKHRNLASGDDSLVDIVKSYKA